MTSPTDAERASAIRTILKQREYQRRYDRRHREEEAAYGRRYAAVHREEKRAYSRLYHQQHRDEILPQQHQYRRQHLKEESERMRLYYEAHREERIACSVQYQQEHPEVPRAAGRKRRALLAGSNGTFTEREFVFLCEAFENRCAYCRKELQLTADHVVPLSEGGSNTIDNIVPACLSCNSRKGTKTFDEFIAQLEDELSILPHFEESR